MNHAASILQLLDQYKPAFQLKSGSEQLPRSEAHFKEGARETATIGKGERSIKRGRSQICRRNVRSDWVTIETGGGWSTYVFGAIARRHYCINPHLTANQLIRTFLRQHACLKADLHFLPHPSDQALAVLQKEVKVELAYIDGNHSFPISLVDWHYIDRRLRKNGLLLADDN